MRRSPSSKITAERWGRTGEILAALYLQAQFFTIRDRRVKTPVGEIDLVAQRGSLTLFVEVKARADRAREAEALAAVNQRRIVKAAHFYLSRHPKLTAQTIRFDVIFLAPWSWPRHVRNAFDDRSSR